MDNPLIGNRTAEVLSYVRSPLSLSKSVEDLCLEYRSAQPYPHLLLDGFFSGNLLSALIDELPPRNSDKWVHENQERQIKSNLRSAVDLGARAFEFTSVLHSAGFLYLLSEMTGIKCLLPDPLLSGAGYHSIPPGGRFAVHADRNTDFNYGLERRLVVLIYLNHNWKPEYGGQLEIWNQEGTQCEKVIEPNFNRTVMMEIGDKNFHAVRTVSRNTQNGRSRQSFAVYFHTVGKNVVAHTSIFAPKLYREKPSAIKKIARETLPPFLLRLIKKSLHGVR